MPNDLLKFERLMSILLSVYYNYVINNIKDNRYEKTKLPNIDKYADFAWNLSKDNYEFIFNSPIDIEDLVKFDIGHTVKYFSKELLILLNKNLYDIKYQGFFKNFDRFIYLFKIKDTETYFSVDESSANFLTVDLEILKDLMVDENTNRYNIKKQLEDVYEKISEVKLKLNNLTVIDKETEETLVKYYEKIENVELLESFNSIDMERKNLETILKLEQLSI